jgi:hypothetical protein
MLHHGHRRYRIGRRDHGAEHKPDSPGHAKQEMAERRHSSCGEQYASNREQEDWPKVGAKTAPAHVDTRRIKKGRQEGQQHHVGIKNELGYTRRERNQSAHNEQENWGYDVHPTREGGKASNEKRYKKGLQEGRFVHAPIVAPGRYLVEEQTIGPAQPGSR